MIRPVAQKPGCFGELPGGDGFKFYELLYNGEVYGYGALDFRFKPYCLLHLEISKWTPSIYKEIKGRDWNFAKNIIRALDCYMVVLTKKGNLQNQASYTKLIKTCGFPEPVEFTQSTQEI
ncbi:MAG: hypothetical protein GWN94_20695 [Phycisphaerae bacterium]|nr:hypothetical protein [Phycisphaerae bacterium]